MITSYRLELSKPLRPSDGYKLYAWLLTQIPSDTADALHSQQDHPISQYVMFDKERNASIWQVNLLTDEAVSVFSPALERVQSISLNTDDISIVSKSASETCFRGIIEKAHQEPHSQAELHFITASSFKQNGRYVIFPQEKLIIQSLVNRWNLFCDAYPLEDADALRMLEDGIVISDYSLKTVRFHLKNVYIPAFVGKVTVSSRLPVPLAEVWQSVLLWANYCGIGIKTTLGMGGINVTFPS